MGNYRDWSLAVPTIFVITHPRNGGTLPDLDTGVRVRVREIPPIVYHVMTFQDQLKVPKVWALATQHRL